MSPTNMAGYDLHDKIEISSCSHGYQSGSALVHSLCFMHKALSRGPSYCFVPLLISSNFDSLHPCCHPEDFLDFCWFLLNVYSFLGLVEVKSAGNPRIWFVRLWFPVDFQFSSQWSHIPVYHSISHSATATSTLLFEYPHISNNIP